MPYLCLNMSRLLAFVGACFRLSLVKIMCLFCHVLGLSISIWVDFSMHYIAPLYLGLLALSMCMCSMPSLHCFGDLGSLYMLFQSHFHACWIALHVSLMPHKLVYHCSMFWCLFMLLFWVIWMPFKWSLRFVLAWFQSLCCILLVHECLFQVCLNVAWFVLKCWSLCACVCVYHLALTF